MPPSDRNGVVQGAARAAAQIAVIAALAAALSGVTPALSGAATGAMAQNLLLNGDLRAGSGDSPEHWRSEAWEQKPGMTDFKWLRHGSASGELRVINHKANDARWTQTLTLAPGWFYLSAKIRAEHVGANEQGASLSVMEGAIGSPDLRGTTQWQQRGFYLKVGPRGATVEVACRLGGFSSLNTGLAACTDLEVVAVAALPPGADPVFDLDQVRRQYATPPVGRPWTLVAAFALTLALALLGWTVLDERSLGGRELRGPRCPPGANAP